MSKFKKLTLTNEVLSYLTKNFQLRSRAEWTERSQLNSTPIFLCVGLFRTKHDWRFIEGLGLLNTEPVMFSIWRKLDEMSVLSKKSNLTKKWFHLTRFSFREESCQQFCKESWNGQKRFFSKEKETRDWNWSQENPDYAHLDFLSH